MSLKRNQSYTDDDSTRTAETLDYKNLTNDGTSPTNFTYLEVL